MSSIAEQCSEMNPVAARARRFNLATLLLVLAVALFTSAAKAQAPANDRFTNALDLTVTVETTPGRYLGSSLNATRETNEPIHFVGSPNSARSVWFRWTAPQSGIVTFDTIGSVFDTVLASYRLQ